MHRQPSELHVRWVRQEHSQGCGLATLAMLTGCTYEEIRAEHDALTNTAHRRDWNAEGTHDGVLNQILAAHGYYVQTVYRAWHCITKDAEGNYLPSSEWAVKPGHVWPPEPFAPLHYVSAKQPSGNRHYVVMLSDGRVLDPMREGYFRLTDWAELDNVVGVLHPAWLAEGRIAA